LLSVNDAEADITNMGQFWCKDEIGETDAMFTGEGGVDSRINPKATIQFVIDGGGSVITTGVKGDLEIPNDFEIERVTMLADQSGSIVVDIWEQTYASYPPTNTQTITASTPPTITEYIEI
jgi:hypothetical protein